MMSARIEVPFPPRPEPSPSRVAPPWVAVEPRWEYKQVVRDLDREELPAESELNALGNEHWELAGIVREDQKAYFYFKRERHR